MYDLAPLLLIILGTLGIIVLVARKFPALSNLDVDSIPSEKEARFKEQIVGARIKRNFSKWGSKFFVFVKGFHKNSSSFFQRIRETLEQYKEEHSKEGEEAKRGKEERVKDILQELQELDMKEDLEKYESKLIEAIGLDSKNSGAFEELGDLYYENKKYREAEQTYEHILKLLEEKDINKRAEVYYDLALVNKEWGKYDKAWKNVKEALRLVPNNPRFLDIMLEISIMKKDKILAQSTYDKLAEVNPENKKLKEWERKIEEME